MRILLPGLLLAALVWYVAFHKPAPTVVDGEPVITIEVEKAPRPDQTILEKVDDRERMARLTVEAAPLRHLLETSLNIVPAMVDQLGRPNEPVPIDTVRINASRYRGQWLWYEGEITELIGPSKGHPVPGYSMFESWIRTADGERVMFTFSVPPTKGIEVGSFVSVEGFFLKLRDKSFPDRIEEAPMLVGPRMHTAAALWDPITKLDPAMFVGVEDGILETVDETLRVRRTDGSDEDLHDMQSRPSFWRMASYAMHRRVGIDDIRDIEPFTQKAQLQHYLHNKSDRGGLTRILGAFIKARTFQAETNPLGVKYWTEVIVQIHAAGLKGKVIPIWIPGKLSGNWQRMDGIETPAHFFKIWTFDTPDNSERFTPVFVAAGLERYRPVTDPSMKIAAYIFGGFVAFLFLVFFIGARRDRKKSSKHQDRLIESRRKRRLRDRSPQLVGHPGGSDSLPTSAEHPNP